MSAPSPAAEEKMRRGLVCFALGSGHSLLAWLDPNLRARVGAVDGIRDMLLANEVMYSV
jgi:hypothetical protein